MKNCCYSCGDLRELVFTKRGSKIKPREIFEIFYSPLDPLITQNKGSLGTYKRKRKKERITNLREIIPKIKDQEEGLSALLSFDDGGSKKFRVRARTNFGSFKARDNFGSLVVKRPNIIYLEDEEKGIIILREARDPREDLFTQRISRINFKEKFSKKDILKNSQNITKKEILLVPEPSLVLALEQIYNENSINRITPKIKVVSYSSNQMWYIRNFLPSLRDSPMTAEGISEYVGTLHGLGLMERIDSQTAHYCREGNNVVNIDPDFFAFTLNQKSIDYFDWSNLKKDISEEFLYSQKDSKEMPRMRREIIERVKSSMKKSSLLEYLPKTPKDSVTLKSLLVSDN